MASLGLPAFESPAPRPNKDALHRILESVVTTNERLDREEDRVPPAVRPPPASTPQVVLTAPRFRSAGASWQEADDPNMYDVNVPMRATNADDKSFSGLFSSGAHFTDVTFASGCCALTDIILSVRGWQQHVNQHTGSYLDGLPIARKHRSSNYTGQCFRRPMRRNATT